MQLGDIQYTFTDNDGAQQKVLIPAEVLKAGRREGLSNKESIARYLCNEGYHVDAVKPSQTKTKRKSTRKPNETKQRLINALADVMTGFGGVDVVNPERQVQVNIDGTVFEWTLVQKRKKN